MSARYDVESIMDEVLSILTSNLNTKLAAIDTEKGALTGGALATVDEGAYFLQELNGKTANYNPFILYQVQDIKSEEDEHSPYASTLLEIAVVLVHADEGQDDQIGKRMFRYGRALKEVFEENWELPESSAKLKVSSKVPVEVQLLNSSNIHRAIGVTLRVELG